jgi:hypothetical protein
MRAAANPGLTLGQDADSHRRGDITAFPEPLTTLKQLFGKTLDLHYGLVNTRIFHPRS